jgi:CubicO group peptidase (beta-lactamase class C family)
MQINGFNTARFAPVREAFAANFADGSELGATVSVWLDGEPVVDLHGGVRDPQAGAPLAPDDLFNVWSTSKGMAALSLAMAVDRGLLAYTDPVARHWPEYGVAGKQDVTVGMLVSHAGGICGFDEPCSYGDLIDLEGGAAKLAAQAPLFEPGSANAYNAGIFGHWVDALLRRTDGRSLSRFFREEVAGPLEADVWLGLPADQLHRRAPMEALWADQQGPLGESPLIRQAFGGPRVSPLVCNREDWILVGNGAAGGSANARGLAKVYAALAMGGTLDGVRLISPEGLARATALQREGKDKALRVWVRWGAGFILSAGGLYGPNDRSFGHSGWGGSLAFADPDTRLSFAYAMNRMAPNLAADPRSLRLIAAAYEGVRGGG